MHLQTWGVAAEKIPLPECARYHAVASLSLSSLLSAGAKSHVSAASGRVDSFTNRNVKRCSQGGRRDEQEPNKHGPQSRAPP